jgi:drug/metabolite transporter (DMT)-like permease
VHLEYLSVPLALIAACSNAASNVIQRITNRAEQGVRTLSLRLVVDLLHRPLWFAGIGAITFSFVLQASALRFGPLALVEPLLVCELPLTFVGAVIFLHSPMRLREMGASVIMTAGLAGLVAFLDPHGGTPTVSPLTWVVGLVACFGAVAALVIAGKQAEGDRRAALYGAATGIDFGTTAALMKGAVAHLSSGPQAIFMSWETYAMVAAGILGIFLVQNALQAGKLLAAQPGITLLDPFVAIVWGLFAFGEQGATGTVHLALTITGGLLMVAGVLLLSRSPILEHHHRAPKDHPEEGLVRQTSDAA